MSTAIRCTCLLAFLIGSAGCYRTRMMPPVTILISDEHGERVPDISGFWKGTSNEEFHEEHFTFDENGRAAIAPYFASGDVLRLIGQLLVSLFPHQSGLHEPQFEVNLVVPREYRFDAPASGWIPVTDSYSFNPPSWKSDDGSTVREAHWTGTPIITHAKDGRAVITPTPDFQGLCVVAWNAAKLNALNYRFVFTRKLPATVIK